MKLLEGLRKTYMKLLEKLKQKTSEYICVIILLFMHKQLASVHLKATKTFYPILHRNASASDSDSENNATVHSTLEKRRRKRLADYLRKRRNHSLNF